MDWLPQPFSQLSGPAFLLVYAAFAAAVIVISRVQVIGADRSLDLPLPSVSVERDPFEVAYLRGGGNELLRFTIFDATRRNLLRVVPPDRKKKIEGGIEALPSAAEQTDLPPLTAEVVRYFAATHTTDELFASPLAKAAEAEGATRCGSALAAERFLAADAVHAAATRVRIYGIAALLVFAGLRFAEAAVRHHRNVGFLIVETLVAVGALFLLTRVERLSRRGRAFLERLRTALRPQGLTPVAAGVGLLPIFVAATGMSALAGTEYAPMNLIFRRAASNGGSCGCGSASSGGSSGSSCGGGCGGGCGG